MQWPRTLIFKTSISFRPKTKSLGIIQVMEMSRVNVIFPFRCKQKSENFVAVMLHKCLVHNKAGKGMAHGRKPFFFGYVLIVNCIFK